MEADKTLNLFYELFKGNPSFYVRHQAPFTEKEGKLKASWCGFAVYNKRTPPPEGEEEGGFIPVTKELYREHLNGGDGLAIAPLTNTDDKRNVCFYAAIDIDVYNVNYTWLVSALYSAGFKFAAFLSKSGGLHIYFFFIEPEAGNKVIEALEKIVEVYGLRRIFTSEKNIGKVEVFPKQAVFVPGKSNVNCLFLPFYNAANKGRQNLLTAEGKLIGVVKALPIVESMLTSVKEINGTLRSLPYEDAPYCVQAILLAGVLEENDGRNNFLFTAALYLKRKYKSGFKEILEEMNERLSLPLEQKDVDTIYASVDAKDYKGYLCKTFPCADYCDKALCKKRVYGAGRSETKSSTEGGCWGEITKVMSNEPYYLWNIRAETDGAYHTVRVDSVDDLLNQTEVRKCCLRDLNWMPFRLSDDDWTKTVNEALTGVEGRLVSVAREIDATETGALWGLFVRYLTRKQTQNCRPDMVRLGQVYVTEGTYYFSVDGFIAFLRAEKFPRGKINLRDALISYGCTEGDLEYRPKRCNSEVKKIRCWKKTEDAELAEMSVFYGDVCEDDIEVLQKDTEAKKDTEGVNDKDVKF